jgi:hypothetical protein
MSALIADRNTARREDGLRAIGVGATQKIFAGALLCRNATGFGVKGATSTTLVALGRAEEQVDNSAGADGALTITYRQGCFKFANSAAGDLITAADIGNTAYIVDDQTVAKTNGTNTRSAAGKIDSVEADGVWVWVGVQY